MSPTRKHDSQSSDETLFILPEPTPKKKNTEKPDWKSLIKRIWGGDPAICPCCRRKMKNVGTIIRRAEIEFFLKLWGMWEGIISLPPPPDPPFDIETMEPEALATGLGNTGRTPSASRRMVASARFRGMAKSRIATGRWESSGFDAEPLPAEESRYSRSADCR